MRLIILLTLCFSVLAQAGDAIIFSSIEQEQRYKALLKELRCAKCQNQNLADSDAPLAKDLRVVVLEMVEQGKTNQDIKSFMVDRYGNFVLYRPPMDKNTLFLWLGPLIILLGALWFVFRLIKARQSLPEQKTQVSDEEQAKVDLLLNENKQGGTKS